MKKVLFMLLMFVSLAAAAQPVRIKIDTVTFIRAGVEQPVLDNSLTSKLEQFKDETDAVLYIYRLKAMAGAAVKWMVVVDSKYSVKLAQNEYVAVHLNTTEKSHVISEGNMTFNYTDFKPHTYYKIRLRGFSYVADYVTLESAAEIFDCKKGNLVEK
jgi:hypothetical protein